MKLAFSRPWRNRTYSYAGPTGGKKQWTAPGPLFDTTLVVLFLALGLGLLI